MRNSITRFPLFSTYGSLVACVMPPQLEKLINSVPKVIPIVHLGYSFVQNGYILYDIHSKLFFVSMYTVLRRMFFPSSMLYPVPLFFPILDLSEADCSSLNCIPTPGNTTAESPSSISSQPIGPSQLVFYHHLQSSSSNTADPPPIRKSSRTYVPLIWLKYYVVPSKGAAYNYSISKYVCYDKLSPAYQACLAAYSPVSEPTSYAEASNDPKWIEAM